MFWAEINNLSIYLEIFFRVGIHGNFLRIGFGGKDLIELLILELLPFGELFITQTVKLAFQSKQMSEFAVIL
jgi:hypothetical protein